MRGSWSPQDFPRLIKGTHTVTSPGTEDYNCFAWVFGDQQNVWDPDPAYYWPNDVSRRNAVGVVGEIFEKHGFRLCRDGKPETGYEKIAIYSKIKSADDDQRVSHVARQLKDGKWTSKMGYLEDITHNTPAILEGPSYGWVARYMKRAR